MTPELIIFVSRGITVFSYIFSTGRVRKVSPPPGFNLRTAQLISSRHNIRLDLKKTQCEALKWIPLTQLVCSLRALVNTLMRLRVIGRSVFLTSCVIPGLSGALDHGVAGGQPMINVLSQIYPCLEKSVT